MAGEKRILHYATRRILTAMATLVLVSFISFVIIILPPGDVLTAQIQRINEVAGSISEADLARVDFLREEYGLDRSVVEQYTNWMSGIITEGDFGWSFTAFRRVDEFIWGLMANTMIIVGGSLLFIFAVALPIGFYSAVKQYSLGDYVFTFFGFLGLAIPNFLLALFLLYLSFAVTGSIATGMYSPAMIDQPWTWAKFVDLLKHVWIPVFVIGSAGTASAIRTLRNNLLDELHKPYVMMARSKGVNELRLLIKYPLRLAINPLLGTIGFLLPSLFGATIIVSIVLSLPTVGPIYLEALLTQDMFLAGTIVLMIAVATILGTLISDILLALSDPRIRLE